MTRNGRHLYARHDDSNQDPHHQESTRYYSADSRAKSTSTYQSNVAQDVAYSYQSDPATYQYPQELEIDVPSISNSQYRTQPQQPYYDAVSRCWRYTNPNVHQMTTAPALDHNYNTQSTPMYQTCSNPSTAAMYADKRRPTEPKLEVLDYTSPPTSARSRWEQQGQRTGPWNAVGYVRNEERRQ